MKAETEGIAATYLLKTKNKPVWENCSLGMIPEKKHCRKYEDYEDDVQTHANGSMQAWTQTHIHFKGTSRQVCMKTSKNQKTRRETNPKTLLHTLLSVREATSLTMWLSSLYIIHQNKEGLLTNGKLHNIIYPMPSCTLLYCLYIHLAVPHFEHSAQLLPSIECRFDVLLLTWCRLILFIHVETSGSAFFW